jgi:hypothetical protein
MESHQALVALNATFKDLERSVNELLCPKEFSVNAHEKREEIFQELQRLYHIEQTNLTKNPNSQWRDELLTRYRENALVTRPFFARGGTKVDLTAAAELSLSTQLINHQAADHPKSFSSSSSLSSHIRMELEEEKTAIVLPPSSLPIQSSDNAKAANEEELYILEKDSNDAVILSPVEQESLIVSLNSTVKTTLYSIFTANVQVEELAKQFVDDPRFMKCIKEEIGSLGLYLNRSGKFDKSLHLVVYGLATNCS